MVLVDTSVWIDLFRKKNTPLGEKVWRLVAKNEAMLCGQVFVEFIGGFRNAKRRAEFAKPFSDFPYLETTREMFFLAADLLGDFPRLGSGDAVIAATAMLHNEGLLTLDRDFQELESRGLRLVPVNTHE